MSTLRRVALPLPLWLSPLSHSDMAPVLFNGSRSLHNCIMFYAQAVAADADNQLYAVRCGDYKMYWKVRSTIKQPYPAGVQDPPLLFNLTADPSESKPIKSDTHEYAAAMKTLSAARAAHLATIRPVPDQNGRGSNASLAFCANPHSQATYPQLPPCTITPANFMPKDICGAPRVCASRFDAQCRRPMCSVTAGGCPVVNASAGFGCFADHVDGKCDLPDVMAGQCPGKEMPEIEGMDLDICNALCKGHAYFGVQYGGSGCFCGEAYGRFGTSTACNRSCAGDPSEICGGKSANSIYGVVVAA